MSNADFDTLTDWIGIPLVLVLIGLIIATDVAAIRGTRPRRTQLVVIAALVVVITVIAVLRFARFA